MNANTNNTVLRSHVTTTVATSCATCTTHSSYMTTKQQIILQQTIVVSQVDIECNTEKHNWWFDCESADGCKLKGFSVGSTVTMNYNDTGITITLEISYITKYVNGYSLDVNFGPTKNVHTALVHYGNGTLQPDGYICKEYCSYGDI